MVDYVRPCKTKKISDDFADHKARGSGLPGIDYVCPIGETVWASAEGVVIKTSNRANQPNGKHVVIEHPDKAKSYYLHLSEISVKVGQHVTRNEHIGKSGNTSAGNSTGAHLHFTLINSKGKATDPAPVLKASLERINAAKAVTITPPENSE